MSKGSVFAKVRKEAKEKAKKQKDSHAEGMTIPEQIVKRDIAEIPPIDEKELNSLLTAATEEIKVAKAEPVSAEAAPVVETKANGPKIFQAHGLYYDSEKRKFIKVTIEYDPKSDYCKVLEHLEYSDSSAVASFKINNLFSMKLVRDQDIT